MSLLAHIINLAEAGYGSPLPRDGAEVGDGLASFIVTELTETADGGIGHMKQLEAAIRVMKTAQDQLGSVVAELEQELEEREAARAADDAEEYAYEQERRRDEAEYQQGVRDVENWKFNKSIYGDEVADAMEIEREIREGE